MTVFYSALVAMLNCQPPSHLINTSRLSDLDIGEIDDLILFAQSHSKIPSSTGIGLLKAADHIAADSHSNGFSACEAAGGSNIGSGVLADLLEVTEALAGYVDAIPDEAASMFPAMPGIDRDWADSKINSAKNIIK